MASKKSSSTTNNDMTMKIVIITALAMAFIVGYFVARAKYKPQILELTKMVADKDQTMQKMRANANKVMMKDSAMWIVENGIVKQMDNDVLMSNGDKVTIEGKVIKADKSEVMMRNGEAVDMEGKMMSDGAEGTSGSQKF